MHRYLTPFYRNRKHAIQDELDDAYHTGELSDIQYQRAIDEGEAIISDLCSNMEATQVNFYKILNQVWAQIQCGNVILQNNIQIENVEVN